MTTREMMEMIINGNEITEEMQTKAHEIIEGLDRRNAKRANTPSKKAKENEPIKANIANFLEGKDFTIASVIAEGLELTTQKVSALCRQMVADGTLTVTDVKVKGKGSQKGYKVA